MIPFTFGTLRSAIHLLQFRLDILTETPPAAHVFARVANRCCRPVGKGLREPRSTRSRNFNATSVSSSQVEGGEKGVWLRVRILNSLVLSFRTTVRAIRDSLREANQ